MREAPFWVAGCYRAACSYTQQSSTAWYTSPQLGIRLHPLPFPNSKLNKAHVGPTIVWPRGSAHTREPRLRSLRVLCPPFPSGLLRSSIDGTPPFATESWCAHLWLWLWRQQGRSSSPPAPRLRSRRARRQPSSAASASLAPVADVRRRHVPTRAELSSHPLLLAARRGRDTAPSPVASPPPGPRRRSLRALAAARRQPLTPLPPPPSPLHPPPRSFRVAAAVFCQSSARSLASPPPPSPSARLPSRALPSLPPSSLARSPHRCPPCSPPLRAPLAAKVARQQQHLGWPARPRPPRPPPGRTPAAAPRAACQAAAATPAARSHASSSASGGCQAATATPARPPN